MFFGTDEYAVKHLKELNANRTSRSVRVVDTLDVVVPSAKCAVGAYAQSNGLRLHEWSDGDLSSSLDGGRSFDVGVVVSFGHLLPKRIIEAFPYGMLNVHPSILPRWRGASPILHTILNGDEETGISIIQIRPSRFDVGPLLLQECYPVPENCTTLQLRDYLAIEGATLLLRTLQDLKTLVKREVEQDNYGFTYARKLSVGNARVKWETQSPISIDRQYRAFSEMYGLRSQWKNQPVRLLDMVPLVEMHECSDIEASLLEAFPDTLMSVRPGIAHYCSAREILCIRCLDGWVGFQGITIKKPMTAKSFYNGYLSRAELRGTAFESLENGLSKHVGRGADRKVAQPVEALQRMRLMH